MKVAGFILLGFGIRKHEESALSASLENALLLMEMVPLLLGSKTFLPHVMGFEVNVFL